MAKNIVLKPGYQQPVVVTHPAAPNSGDPIRFGKTTGIAILDEAAGGAGATETVVDLGPMVAQVSVDDNEGTGIAVGDPIYYHDTGTGTPATSLNNSATGADAFFGYALAVVSANATTTINVLHVPVGHTTTMAGTIGTGQIADDAVTSAKVEPDLLQYVDVQLTNAEMLALRATPKTVIAAPGANKTVIVHRVHAVHSGAAGAYTESADNIAVEYSGGTDILVIETTGFIDQASVQVRTQGQDFAVATPVANEAVQIKNNGDGEFGGGNAATTFSIRVWFSIADTIAFS